MGPSAEKSPKKTKVENKWVLPIPSLLFSTANWFSGLLVFCTSTVIIPILLLSQLSAYDSHIDYPVILAFTSVAYSGLHLSLLSVGGHRKLLSLTFWVFVYIWMGLTPFVQIAAGVTPWPGAYNQNTLVYSMVILLLGLVSYDLGALIVKFSPLRRVESSFLGSFAISKQRIYLLSFLAVVLTVVSIWKLGGLQVVLGTRYSFEQALSSGPSKSFNLTWSTLLRAPAFAALALNWWLWLNRKYLLRGRAGRQWHIALLLFLVLLNSVANNPQSQTRFWLGTMVLSLVFMSLKWSKRYTVGLIVVSMLFLLLVAFPYLDIFRSQGAQLAVQPVAVQLLLNGDYDPFQQLLNTVNMVSSNGTTWGFQSLGAFLFWVPRAVWHGKPYGSGQLVAEYMGYPFTNLSSPLWAEAYINFGLAGVILVLFLYGAVTSLAQSAYIKSFQSVIPSPLQVLVPILAAYQIFFLRGDLQNAVAFFAPLAAYFLLASNIHFSRLLGSSK
jgi:hypothetical protein